MVVKKIYLTVDDGPSRYTKDKVDYLYSKNIPALWYCRGEYINSNTIESLVYLIKHGFVVANHSFTHPYFSTISFDKAKEEILSTEKLIEKAYKRAGVPQNHKLFRFPYLDKGGKNKDRLQEFLKQEGFSRACFEGVTYKYYLEQGLDRDIDAPWTFDACEYALFSKKSMQKRKLFSQDDFIQRMYKNLPEEGFGLLYPDSSDIVLLHDFDKTHVLFEPMVDALADLSGEFLLPRFD